MAVTKYHIRTPEGLEYGYAGKFEDLPDVHPGAVITHTVELDEVGNGRRVLYTGPQPSKKKASKSSESAPVEEQDAGSSDSASKASKSAKSAK